MKRLLLFLLVLSLLFASSGCGAGLESSTESSCTSLPDASDISLTDEYLTVTFIDVGQGDSIHISLPGGENILVDAGPSSAKKALSTYFAAKGVSRFEYAFFTHPHADHIGCAAEIIKSYDIGTVYMPAAITTTKTFESLMSALEEKEEIEVAEAKAYDILQVGDLFIEILAPVSDSYKSLNNYSIVLRLSYGEVSFLLCADAEKLSENEMLSEGYDLDSDIIKVGHHGSSTSSSALFLEAVSAKAAVISCGTGNSYGHPDAETMEALSEIDIYRTDTDGTITFICDLTSYEVSVSGK